MSYHLAPSLAKLRAQIDAAWPNRSKASDGWIGDAAHNARKSDHNPDYSAGGVVRAIDVTAKDINVKALLKAVKADPRTSYVIHKGKIYGASQFRARRYTGANAHNHHVHISVKAGGENGGAWALKGSVKAAKVPRKQLNTTTPNGSTTFPKTYEDLFPDGDFKEITVGAAQILLHNAGYRINRQWDGDDGELFWKDMQSFLAATGFLDTTKWLIDGKPETATIMALQTMLVARGFLDGDKWLIDGIFETATIEAFQRYLNARN